MPKSRGERRKKDFTKAIKKSNIVRRVYRLESGWYDNLHEYSKGKIHCSCPMCSAKTNKKRRGVGYGYDKRDRQRMDAIKEEIKLLGSENYGENPQGNV